MIFICSHILTVWILGDAKKRFTDVDDVEVF